MQKNTYENTTPFTRPPPSRLERFYRVTCPLNSDVFWRYCSPRPRYNAFDTRFLAAGVDSTYAGVTSYVSFWFKNVLPLSSSSSSVAKHTLRRSRRNRVGKKRNEINNNKKRDVSCFILTWTHASSGDPKGRSSTLSSIGAKLKYRNFHDYYLLYLCAKRNRSVKILSTVHRNKLRTRSINIVKPNVCNSLEIRYREYIYDKKKFAFSIPTP